MAAQESAPEAVEVVVNGKAYASMREYRLERIKLSLARALASENLNDFSPEELVTILLEVRRQQVAEKDNGGEDGP